MAITQWFAADQYPGPALVRLLDAPSYLWHAELAGHPRDPVRWQVLHEFAHRAFPARAWRLPTGMWR
jgi:hypothetical protein